MKIVAQQGEYVLVRVEVRDGKSYGYVVSIPDLKITSSKICLDPAVQDPHWGEPSLTDDRKRKILEVVRARSSRKKKKADKKASKELEDLEPEDGVFAYSPEKRGIGGRGKTPDPQKLLTYIELLESTNEQLVFALKKCLEVLSEMNPPGDRNKWQEMLDGFEKIAKVGERLSRHKH